MRVKIPEFASQKERNEYLKTNREDLIFQKKMKGIEAEGLDFFAVSPEKGFAVKALADDVEVEPGSLVVHAVANLAMFCDSYMDVMITDSWNKSIKDRGTKIPFLKNHVWDVDNTIAKTLDVYVMDLDLKKMGIKSDIKAAQGLIFVGELSKELNEPMYIRYKKGMVQQHSIGLRYLQILLAINDPDDKEEYKVWNKYFPEIINKDYVEKIGYFWAVKEAIIYENSAVLYGANEMTPTLSTEEKSLESGEPHLVKCGGCGLGFDYLSVPESGMGYVECPGCKSAITQDSTPKRIEPNNNDEFLLKLKNLYTK